MNKETVIKQLDKIEDIVTQLPFAYRCSLSEAVRTIRKEISKDDY